MKQESEKPSRTTGVVFCVGIVMLFLMVVVGVGFMYLMATNDKAKDSGNVSGPGNEIVGP